MGQAESKVDEWKAKTRSYPKHVQVRTSAWNGGDDMVLLRRFLYLGTESVYSSTFVYPDQKYADLINRLIYEGRGKEVVQLLATINYSGSAPRHNYIIFALAVCARSDDISTKKLAYDNLCQICRIPTHFFMFVDFCQFESEKSQSRSKGWGRAHRRAVLKWYEEKCKNPEGLARLLTTYNLCTVEGHGNRWSHKDIFRLGHLSSDDDLMKVVKTFVLFGFKKAQSQVSEETKKNERVSEFLTYIGSTIKAKICFDEDELVGLIKRHGLGKQRVSKALMTSKNVWEAILKTMQPEAEIDICMLSAKGLCGEDSEIEKEIIEKITNADFFHRARVHPIRVLSVLLTYEKGEKRIGRKSNPRKKRKWNVNKNIVKALNEAYEFSFRDVQPTGKHVLLAVDVSENMRVSCKGCPTIMCNQAAASMMMMTARTEPNCKIFGFSEGFTQIRIDEDDTFSQTVEKMESLPSGKADCAIPMLWAKQHKEKIDVFIVYTDNIPTNGQTNPSKALEEYRRTMNQPETKLILVAMAPNPDTTADPSRQVVIDSKKATTHDDREINIVGFDAHAATLIAKFIQDEL
ncbi:RNA-binding protein Ro60-like [Mercenaria mercenaria]|uniref:RNA-binding protein Ro60-like n=1 Tax=Mercenaria mercenaria TaxID=6596 RepID=UPI00234F61B6|nr:RNA-binding protein Ro60-like [Mercenaria mercenaria]